MYSVYPAGRAAPFVCVYTHGWLGGPFASVYTPARRIASAYIYIHMLANASIAPHCLKALCVNESRTPTNIGRQALKPSEVQY